MAMCEKCRKDGYAPMEMFIEANLFVGPCCKASGMTPVDRAFGRPAEVVILPAVSDDIEYGVELSNKKGVHAFLRYGGLQIGFERSPSQIKQWAEKNGLVDQPATRKMG